MLLTALCKAPSLGWLLPTKLLLRIMKLTAFIMLMACLTASAGGYSQKVTISEKNAPIEKVFRMIEQQTGYVFFYDYALIGQAKKVNIQVKDIPLPEVLKLCFKDQPLTYTIIDKTIVVKPKQQGKPGIEIQQEAPVIDVAGMVTDESGIPLKGASVKVKGREEGTVSDGNGHFLLRQIDENAVLIISFVGYDTKEVPVNKGRAISIQLKLSIDMLNETVIIAYGTTTRRTSTASISSITAEEISKQPVANPLNALQGRMAGALVTQSNGLPGSRVTIQIRGVNSIDPTGAGTQPLYIVDGVPFNIYDNSVPATNDLNGRGNFAAAGGLSPFNVINPADIERIDVLKDADATAIYGTRGANGVVLITTRKGKAGKTKLDINVYQGQGKVGHFIPMMNAQQYRQMRWEAYANDAITPNSTNAPDLFLWDSTLHTDWQKKYLGQTASVTDAQVSVSGGDQRTRFLLNAGYHRETPVFPGDYKAQRVSTRLHVDHNSADKKFNAGVSVNYAFDNTNLLNQDLSWLYNLPPNLPVYNPDGSLYWNANFTNPESYLFVKYFGKTHNLMANTSLRYTILPGLDLKTNFGFNRVQLDQNAQLPARSKNPLTGAPTNSATFANIDQKSYILEPQITYTKNILGGKLSALLGSTFQHSVHTSLRLSGDNYSTPALLGSIVGAGTVGTPGYSYTQYRYSSGFGRLTYDWKAKYLLNAVLRRDGSSRFGPGRKFANFWDIGAGWVFSDESFVKPFTFLSFGKLRASYGVTGNDQIQDYLFRAFYNSSGTYQNGSALAPGQVENRTLHWQTTYKLEFGLDLAFLNKRIELTTNYYRNRTPDQLSYLMLASQAGFNSYASNFDARIQNTGWEFELNTNNIDDRDFKWKTSFNLTIPRTKLLSASPNYFYYNKNVIGQPLSVALRFAYQGVDPTTGRPLYKDLTKDSLTFTPNFSLDRSVAGFSAPKLYGGLNNVLDYKNFELTFFFQFTSQEGNIRPGTAPGVLGSGNQTTFWLDRWTKSGDTDGLPRYTTTSSIYSAWSASNAIWGNASFIRLRTVNLSYSFPRTVISRLKLDNLRIYLQGQNLWWTSKNKYVYDPETGTAMPPLRVITAGINVTL
jgi:TonB-linked SusC/RagA family outer membrane protein